MTHFTPVFLKAGIRYLGKIILQGAIGEYLEDI